MHRLITCSEMDPETGQEIRVGGGGTRHTVFWIPMQYWGIVVALFGVIYAFAG